MPPNLQEKIQEHYFAVFGVVLLSLWSFTNISALAVTHAANSSAAANSTANAADASWLSADGINT